MMVTFFILGTEAHEAGFGLNLDILDTNLLNLAILVGVLVYFGRNALGNILRERQERIAEAIQEAEERKASAATALAKEQENLAQAKATAADIIKAAEARAEAAKVAIAAQAEQDIQRMKETAAKDLSGEQEKVIAELRQRIGTLAIGRVEEQLKAQLDESAQQRLIDKTIAQLGG
jgi:F-type H+-transporting ATPase subunit b